MYVDNLLNLLYDQHSPAQVQHFNHYATEPQMHNLNKMEKLQFENDIINTSETSSSKDN